MFKKKGAFVSLTFGLLITLLLLIFRAEPKFDYDFEQFFPQDDPDLEFYRTHKSVFGGDNDYLLIALTNGNQPWQDSTFLTKAFTAQSQIQDLEKVDTLISILDLGIPVISPFGLRTKKVLDWESSDGVQFSPELLDQFRSTLISKDGKSLLFLVQNQEGIAKEEGDTLYSDIQAVLEKHALDPVAVAGKIQTQSDFVTLMQREFGLFLGASVVLIILLLILVFRSWWGVVIPVLVLCLGILWTFSLILKSGKALDVMSVMQPTLFLIVGMSALVHYFSLLKKKLKSESKDQAIEQTFEELTPAVALTVLTTSLGFLSLYFTSIPALQDFGLWTGLGILLLFFVILVFTPGLIYLFPVNNRPNEQNQSGFGWFPRLFLGVLKSKKTIFWSFLLLTSLALWAGTQLRVNGFLLDNLPLDHPIQEDFSFFDRQYGGSNPLELSLEAGEKANSILDFEVLEELNTLEEKLGELFPGSQFVSPVSLVKTLNQAQNQGSVAAFRFPSRGQYQRMSRYFGQLDSWGGNQVLSDDGKLGRISSRTADLGSWEMGKKRAELLSFVQEEMDTDLLRVRWTGTGYLIDRGHASVTWQMAKGLGVAFLIVGIIGGFLFRSWRISLILLIPNTIPLIWMLGMMYLLGIDFKLTTAILFTVAFGIAVDDTIHFMTKLKLELEKGKSMLYGIKRTFMEAGRAIFLTTLILVSGFALLIFSKFGVTHFTGLLISFSLIFAWLGDMFLLPVLLFPLKKVWESKQAKKQSKLQSIPREGS
ncbi:efflux RND transporter permease subunit [Algoriphagus confluentis]|uniref:MMPL family transporter n=1 Tax=Algoriphagus confluentis TaxID=1697556 RepID=A0ABQ6PNF6_9BACT|nr:MMPL family transporter [Algoriphagus confluentis]